VANAEVQVADAELPPGPPGSFDAVLASLVLFFLPGLPDALRRYAELLAPGGRLAFTSFARDDERWAPVNELLESYAPEERRRPKGDPAEVGPFDSPAVMAELLSAAQFTAVRTRTSSWSRRSPTPTTGGRGPGRTAGERRWRRSTRPSCRRRGRAPSS
jgi:SAM-dependent methyltransferase